MSSSKIDPKQVISRIFAERPSSGKRETDVDRLAKLVGNRRVKPAFNLEFIRQFLSRVFKNEFAGIDIGKDSIKFVLLSQENKRLCLKDFQVEPLGRLSEDGKPENPSKEILNSLVKIASRVKSKTKASIGLNDSQLYTSLMTVPKGTEQETREAVRKDLGEQHLIDLKTNFFDYISLDGTENEASRVQNLFVVSCPQEIVYRQFETVQSAGFRVLAVETNGLAAVQAIQHTAHWDRNERVIVVDIGAQYTNLLVLVGQKIVLNRIIPIAGERFTTAVQEAMGCNFSKAEQLKIKYGMRMVKEPAINEEEQKVANVIKDEVVKLVAEIKRSVQFAFNQEGQEDGVKLNTAFLFGGSSRMQNVKQFISESLDVRILDVDLWKNFYVDEKVIDKDFLRDNMPLASVAMGLALRVTEWTLLPFGLGVPG